MVVDGQAGPECEGIGKGTLIFSPDGNRVAYAYGTYKGRKWRVVVDGEAGPEYDGICKGTLVFNPDRTLEYLAIKGGVLFRVKDARALPK